MGEVRRVAGLLICALVVSGLVAGCGGRSYMTERELEELSATYVRLLTGRRLDEAARFLSGEARQAAALAFPLLQAMDVQQQLVEIKPKAERVIGERDRGAVRVAYRVRTDVPGSGTSTQRVEALLEWIRREKDPAPDDPARGWRIYKIAILNQEAEP